jgi:hypothetical protein
MALTLLYNEFEIHFTFFSIPKKQICQGELLTSGKHSVVSGDQTSTVFSAPLNGGSSDE